MARQNFVGLVISHGKMQKTVKVRVETKVFNKRLNKEMMHRKDYLVHDEGESAREGDVVRIEATRPLSRRKYFSVAEILKNQGQRQVEFQADAKRAVRADEAARAQAFLERREQRTTAGTTLVADVAALQEAYTQGTLDSPEVAAIRERYGVSEFTPDTLQKLLELDVTAMEQEVMRQRTRLEDVLSRLEAYMQDQAAADAYLRSKNVEAPEELKKHTRKNLLRKHITADLLN